MTRTISRLFDNPDEAAIAVHDLETAGIAKDAISVIAPAPATGEPRSFAESNPAATDQTVHASHGLAKGAAIGGGLGGGLALITGVGLLAVPGMGPVLAAGFLTFALAGAAGGAATGTMLGALRDAGHSDDDARALAEGVRRGQALVSVQAPEHRATEVEDILVRHGGRDAASRRRDLEASGWRDEDPAPPPIG